MLFTKGNDFMTINFNMLKQNNDCELYLNIDEFYKMQYDCIIDAKFDTIDDLFDLQSQLNLLKISYKILKNELKKYNINDYVLLCDCMHEKIYIYDKNNNEIYYIDNDCVFCENYEMYQIDNDYNKLNVMHIFLNVMLYDVK